MSERTDIKLLIKIKSGFCFTINTVQVSFNNQTTQHSIQQRLIQVSMHMTVIVCRFFSKEKSVIA